MAYFYILKCNNGKNYYGSTRNLENRLSSHVKGENKYTKKKLPVKLIYFEEFDTYKEALNYERKFKHGKTRRTTIEKAIKNFPSDKLKRFNPQ